MDDDEDDSHSQKNQGKGIVINISKGGGIGIGVGIILVGGAFLLNAFFKRPSSNKPTNFKKHLQHHSDNHTDNGKEKAIGSGVSGEISAHKLFEDGDHKFETSNGEKDRLECNDDDDQEITSCSKDSESQAMECNGCVVETDQISSLAITDPLLHQLTREEAGVKFVSCIEVNGDLIDHDDQEKDSKADIAKHGEDDDLLNLESIEDSKMNEFPEAVHEDNSTSNAEILEENVCRYSETNATFEADQGDEDKINIAIHSEGKGTEGENQLETPCPDENTAQYDGLIDQVQIDGPRGEIDLQDSSNGVLTTSDARVLDENELLEEPKSGEEPKTPKLEEKEAVFEVETNAETQGIQENKAEDIALYSTVGEVFHDEEETQLDVHTKGVAEAAEIDSSIEHWSKLMEYHVINEAIEDTNEKEIQHDVHTNAIREAAEIDSSIEHTSELVESQLIDEETDDKEAQHEVHINAAGEAVEIDSGSKKSSELIEIQTIPDQDNSHVSHQITTDNILPQENDQNISSSESSILQELNPATGLKIDSKDVGIDLHSIEPVTEKDIIYQETDESSQEHLANPIPGENIETGSQALIADNVDEISEGSLVQVKDQTDKLQDSKEHVTLQETEKEIHYKEIEDDDATSSENIQTVKIENIQTVSYMNFFKKYMVKLTEQKNGDEKTSLLMRKRGPIVIGTMSALLWPVYYSCLIAVLVMVVYKIQGF